MTQQHITPAQLLHAYSVGVFPMAESRDAASLHWVRPRFRGVFELDGFHISRSLRRRILRGGYEVAVNRDFSAVVAACANRPSTWINAQIADLYQELHHLGHAHSIEVYAGPALIGGVYGVTLGGAFFGESMFSTQTDASKIALAYLVHRLRAGGFALFDTQYLTAHLASLGAVEISRAAYETRLGKALALTGNFTPQGYCAAPASVAAASSSAAPSSAAP